MCEEGVCVWGGGLVVVESHLLAHLRTRVSLADVFPPELNMDYGEPTGLCEETAPNSGVFTRDWTKAKVEMDCTSYTPTITFK